MLKGELIITFFTRVSEHYVKTYIQNTK